MFLYELPEIASNPVSYTFNSLTTTISTSYNLEEPKLTPKEEHTLELIKLALFEIINIDPDEQDPEQYLKDSLKLILSELHIHPKQKLLDTINYHINKEFMGFSELFGLTLDPLIKTITATTTQTKVEHLRYKSLSTNIKINEEQLNKIQNKLSLLCNQDLPLDCTYKSYKIKTNKDTIQITKDYKQLETPLTLIQKQLASPEILSFLWLLIENKIPISIENDTILNSLTYFVPPHAKIYTDIEGYIPVLYTETHYKENDGRQEYSFVSQATENYSGTNIITKTTNSGIYCQMDKDSIKSLNEENKQIFLKQQGKFYYNLQNSNFLKSKGNINFLEKEIELRSKLLLTLARNPVNNADLRKILAIYYDNPTAVLQKARII
jgi:hypothetical protein